MDAKTTVKIKLVGILRKTYGKGAVQIAVEGKTAKIRDIIQKLTENSSREFKRSLIDPELQDPRPNTLILVNGREISVLEGLETPVKNGDKIVLISVSHGG